MLHEVCSPLKHSSLREALPAPSVAQESQQSRTSNRPVLPGPPGQTHEWCCCYILQIPGPHCHAR